MISFSGIDCSGKSTQISKVKAFFESKKKKVVVVWSRGGYTPGILFLKKLFRNKKKKNKEDILKQSESFNKNPKKRKFLFIISLIDLFFYYAFVLRIKNIGKVLICDRYIWDTYIDFLIKYPDYNFENSFLWKLIQRTMLKPKKSFCLFVSPELSMFRSSLKEEPFPEDIETRKKRIHLYETEMKKNRWGHLVDASASIDNVFEIIKGFLDDQY